MSAAFYLALTVLVIAQLKLPKHLAFLPLIIAGSQLGNIEVVPEMTAARILIILGLIRALSGGFFVFSFSSKLDLLFVLFSTWALLSSFGHQADQWVSSPLAARSGLVLNAFGAYLYGRAYLPDITTFRRYVHWLPLILVPLALGMAAEKANRKNYYHIMGASTEGVNIREGKVRAKGPFRHPILAGTAGATAIPFALFMWRLGQKKIAVLGLVSCLTVVLTSASSGPAAAAAFVIGCVLLLWKWRRYLRLLLWGCVALALLYTLISGRGPWFIMARIDLAGGSTGWHRAQLMDQGLRHLDEWWFWGTDITRHWMPTGVSWNPQHTDITNYYLHLGVIGGLPLALCLVWFMVTSARLLLRRIHDLHNQGGLDEFLLWCLGTSLVAHGLSFISISYFDQMFIFFYILLGAVPGLVNSPSLGQHPAMPHPGPARMQEAEAIEARPLRFYS